VDIIVLTHWTPFGLHGTSPSPRSGPPRLRLSGNESRQLQQVFDTEVRAPRRRPERLIGSIRRESLDRVVVFGERHLRYLLSSCEQYYNEARTQLSLKKNAPIPRDVQRAGRVLPLPILGGLHHRYVRV
jgi:hypothetical protein